MAKPQTFMLGSREQKPDEEKMPSSEVREALRGNRTVVQKKGAD